ncbi:MAG: DUF1501 domain-containing protein [Gemmataceae bacterium]
MFTRREMIGAVGAGLGAVGLAALVNRADAAPHFTPRAKRVIQLFMNGGPFQADLFDPKPALNQYAGQRPKAVELRTENKTGVLMAVPFKYAPRGDSGLPVSDAVPRLAALADELCVIRSMHTDNPNHGPALYLMSNGSMTTLRPSLGAWLSYGLGTENANLPAHVVLCPGRPVRFSELWTSAFLPGEHQGTYVNHTNVEPAKLIPFLRNGTLSPEAQRRQLALMRRMNDERAAATGPDAALEARIKAMETAYRMQTSATDAFDVRLEPQKVRSAYGDGPFARGCLMARRLSERGVRFVQVYYGNGQPWDTHGGHNDTVTKLYADIDRPIAALLTDLRARGMLDETLVVWGGEFGRTPTTEGGNGRDHNHWGFTAWLAGGGVKGGQAIGATDEFGFRAVEDKVHVHDLHATILHLMGIDHEKLTYRHAGRDFRLTDVHGRVVKAVLA